MQRIGGLLALLLALAAPQAHGQTALRGVLPGKSDAVAVRKAFGAPVRKVSATRAEHASGDGESQLFVEYRDGVVARIALAWPAGRARDAVFADVEIMDGRSFQQKNALGRLEEMFDKSALVLTYRGSTLDTPVTSLSYYSRDLYDATFAHEPSMPPPR